MKNTILLLAKQMAELKAAMSQREEITSSSTEVLKSACRPHSNMKINRGVFQAKRSSLELEES